MSSKSPLIYGLKRVNPAPCPVPFFFLQVTCSWIQTIVLTEYPIVGFASCIRMMQFMHLCPPVLSGRIQRLGPLGKAGGGVASFQSEVRSVWVFLMLISFNPLGLQNSNILFLFCFHLIVAVTILADNSSSSALWLQFM